MNHLKLLTAFVVVMALPCAASAALILEESFDYSATLSDGDAVGGSNGGTGWSGGWNSSAGAYEENGLTHPFVSSSGGTLNPTSTNNNDRPYSVTGLTDDGDVQWTSFLIDYQGLNVGGGDRLYIFSAGSSADGFGADFSGDSSTVNVTLSTNGTNSGGSSVGSFTNGETALIIMKHSWGVTDGTGTAVTVDMWLNPGSVASEAALGSAITRSTVLEPGELTGGIYPRSSSDNYLFDEFRMGDTLADVAVIPEPSALGLLWLGLFGLLARRGRRS